MKRAHAMKRALRPGAIGVAALLCMAATAQAQVQAQPVPSAGDVQRSVQPPVAPTPRAADTGAVQISKPAPAAPSASSVRIQVRGIKITGATVFSNEMLTSLVGDLMGKQVNVADLQAAAQRITDQYEQAGYAVARAVLPEQDIVDGVVEFLVLEGRVGKVSIDNKSLVGDGQARRMLGEVPAGAVVHEPSLERRLLLLGETPGASRATVNLQPGASTGETDLNFLVEPGPRVSGQVDADNHGNRYTGYYRLTGTVNINSPLGLGDQVQIRALVTDENLRNVRLGYRTPVGGSGLNVGASWSDLRYELGREYDYLRANGYARIGSVFLSYPLQRSLDRNLLATVTYDNKAFKDRVGAVGPDATTSRRSQLLSLALNAYGNVDTGALTPATYAAAAVLSHGELDIKTDAVRNIDATTARTDGGFTKLAATGNLTWPIATNWSLFGAAYGQLASKNLDASEKLSLGGATGVRAYPQGESPGDEGYIVSGEVRYTIPLQPVQVAAFVDAGGIRVNDKPYTAASNKRFLSGAGASITWAPQPTMGLKLMVASRLGSEKVESEPDAATRWWLQGLWRF
ncbi:MAG TPA: ShlB/FhaC/HecB family hemolysin secretion/activation protein [Candidatus Aquabacterium excrementipullorum]|nr:ShlB/FhaC/HecB family hemolysin secretion/activation protein [Candidatus Aquabacterium excrementipullorum]